MTITVPKLTKTIFLQYDKTSNAILLDKQRLTTNLFRQIVNIFFSYGVSYVRWPICAMLLIHYDYFFLFSTFHNLRRKASIYMSLFFLLSMWTEMTKWINIFRYLIAKYYLRSTIKKILHDFIAE